MQTGMDGMDFETKLAEERPRLIRLCAWLTGSPQAAEDLAQDTLMAAWKSRKQLTSLEKIKPWTSAIARNICLNWSRGQRREQAKLVSSFDGLEEPLVEEIPDTLDLELELDRSELAQLLDRALSLLPAETGRMLVEHYIKESSHAEIAAQMNLKPGTVAVRLQRGKITLQRLLGTRLKAESLAFGLIPSRDPDWVETNIWCISCGQHHLLGKYQKGEAFALRCPQCTPEPHSIMVGMDLSQPYYARILGQAKTFKPAYSRLLAALAPVYHQALRSPAAPCPACGSPIVVQVGQGMHSKVDPQEVCHFLLYCSACSWASNKTLSGLVMALPESQKFWREFPRLQIQAGQEIEVQGSPALPTRLRSVTSNAELTVISSLDTFEVMQVHSNVPL